MLISLQDWKSTTVGGSAHEIATKVLHKMLVEGDLVMGSRL